MKLFEIWLTLVPDLAVGVLNSRLTYPRYISKKKYFNNNAFSYNGIISPSRHSPKLQTITQINSKLGLCLTPNCYKNHSLSNMRLWEQGICLVGTDGLAWLGIMVAIDDHPNNFQIVRMFCHILHKGIYYCLIIDGIIWKYFSLRFVLFNNLSFKSSKLF